MFFDVGKPVNRLSARLQPLPSEVLTPQLSGKSRLKILIVPQKYFMFCCSCGRLREVPLSENIVVRAELHARGNKIIAVL